MTQILNSNLLTLNDNPSTLFAVLFMSQLLDCSLYQQQHALARHEAGDQPTEGVRNQTSNWF